MRHKMLVFLYHFAWTLLIFFCIPLLSLTSKRRLIERLTLSLPRDFLDAGNIWIHALSVGEVVSALPLVETLRLKYPEKDIVFTVATTRGMAVARKELEGKVRVLLTMPVDFWWSVFRITNFVKPSVFILVETDIWPGLVDHLRRRGVKSVLINGRISPRTFRSYQRFPIFVRAMFRPFESCLMQSDLDRERLCKIGINPEKVRTVGNIKFDRDWTPMGQGEHKKWLDCLRLEPDRLIWVAGSIHRGEEEILLDVFKRLRRSFEKLHLILAPRRVEESYDILRQARGMGLNAVLKTEVKNNTRHHDVLILNTLGELGRIYGLGQVSFVGGSLVPVGGHNLLEPANFGCPVLFGPHTHNFVQMSESLVEAGGGWRVSSGDELCEAVKTLFVDKGMRKEMGRLAKGFVERNRGAVERVIESLGDL